MFGLPGFCSCEIHFFHHFVMRKTGLLILLAVTLANTSCSKKDHAGEPVMAPEEILSGVMKWVVYQRKHVRLYDNFIAFDTVSNVMDRGAFIEQISMGGYFPLALVSTDSLPHYKLIRLDRSVDRSIQLTIKDYGKTEYAHYQMEGKPLPGFDYVDLNGKVYNKETMTGKIVVIKCWFIRCHSCVLEMPELNKMVAKYQKRDDIVFVSLAFDSPDELRGFLQKKKFDYAVVADQENYMAKDLSIYMYPTHLILDRIGKVSVVVNSAHDLVPMVDKLASLN